MPPDGNSRDDDPRGKASSAPVLALIGIRKSFPGVLAVSDGSLDLLAGEIHALVGANGAGKSTLIKVLTGVLEPDAGEISLAGQTVHFRTPIEARRAGITAIYQEFALVPSLSVHANLLLGREPACAGFIRAKEERRLSRTILNRLNLDVDPDARVGDLSTAQQQLVEIGRALVGGARILVLDEPTASLSPREVAWLFQILRELASQNIAILFVSHRLEEVLTISARVTVMRDGKTIATNDTENLTRETLIEQMVGRPIGEEYPVHQRRPQQSCLEIKSLSGGLVRDVSFSVAHGEVLGLAGLVGAGRTELARLIFGADPRERGTIIVNGRKLDIRNPVDAIREGICLLTEDRKTEGLVLGASIRENFALANLRTLSRLGWIDGRRELTRFHDRAQQLNLQFHDPLQRADELSGGNQQKLLVARWLETNSRVIIFDEPTRGIDVSAKREMYVLINELAANGIAVIVISSEFPEILGICDRVLVMRGGRIAGEIQDVRKATQHDIMALAV
jgi:ABC-type sugar transport system ATPase subunit